jgi:predicted RNase H-like nuclease (RuvC/YqgF family)
MADEEPTQDELLKVIEELQQEIDEKDKEIAELTQSRTGRKKGRGASGPFSDRDEINALESENEDLQKKFDASQEKVSGLREELANINAKFTSLSDEKLALDKLLSLIKKQHLVHQLVIRLLHKLLIFLKFLQMGRRKNINSRGQKKVDQANNLLQPKEVPNKDLDKIILSLIVKKIYLLLILIKALKNHHQLLHLLATDQIKNHQLLDQEKM